ncbi:hypothetical protein MGI18_20270 [Bacillus sp. OVS6]|nr:hypothetical protein MGI18_20270 [Bacillus sp. OVS6]
MSPLTMDARVQFNSEGGILSSGSMSVTFHNKKYKMIFYMGMGRMKIEGQ